MNRNFSLPFPTSLADELLELLLIAIAIIDTRETPHFERAWNFMFLAIMIWCGLCTIEILNDTCGLGMNINAWFIGFRLMALHLIWILLVFSLYIKGKNNNYNINLFNDLPLEKIIIVVDLIETILKYIQSNGNIELILDKFVLEMRNICE